jgi:sulfatase modifying factor 1
MGFNYSIFNSNKNPVEYVNWYDCLEFCNRLSDYLGLNHCYLLRDKMFTNSTYPLSIEKAEITFIKWADGFRLPKEWEWQIAAMAGTNTQYAGANDDESLKRVAWFVKNSGNTTHPVAQKLPNEWGFYDMSGNVWERCENSDEPDKNNYPSARRVARGGSWNDYALFLRSAYQADYSPSSRNGNLGFRVARSVH